MKKEHNIATIFFGIFYLREQLHTYLDIFSKHQYQISRYLGYDKASSMAKSKRYLLHRTESICWKMKYVTIVDPALFAPIKTPWLPVGDLQTCTDKTEMVRVLLKADRSLVKWCEWFLSEEPGNTEASRLFAEIAALTDTENNFFQDVD